MSRKPPSIVWVAALVAASAAALAADPGRGSAAPATQLPGRGLQTTPLQGELRVRPDATVNDTTPRPRAVKPSIEVTTGLFNPAAMNTNIAALTQRFNQFAGKAKGYEALASSVPNIAQQCSTKSFSVQDQKAAGCSASDTVAQCSGKLVRHCIENYSNKGSAAGADIGAAAKTGGNTSGFQDTGAAFGGKKPDPSKDVMAGVAVSAGGNTSGFSTQQFKKTAQAAAEDARALSQMLAQYAIQVEQNAKALLP